MTVPSPGRGSDPARTGGTPEIRVVTEDRWEMWRDLRLRVLSTDPEAFGSTLEHELGYTEEDWRVRVRRGRMVVALVDGVPGGMAGTVTDQPGVTAVVSMWVAPEHRGRGLARQLLDDVLTFGVPDGDTVRL